MFSISLSNIFKKLCIILLLLTISGIQNVPMFIST